MMARLKVAMAVLIVKIIHTVGGFIGKGSSKPGQVVLKFFPNILNMVSLPETIIAVTGSNGKTSTSGLISHILEKEKVPFACNMEGSNQIEGVTTTVLLNSTLSGKPKKDVLLIECDEQYTRYIFKYIKPTYCVVTNLFRDQLTRNGHPEFICGVLKDSIPEQTHLILNADDPQLSLLGHNHKEVTWYGDKTYKSHVLKTDSVYNDYVLCPVCKAPFEIAPLSNDKGNYVCSNCGNHKHDFDDAITQMNLDEKKIVINRDFEIALTSASLASAYNTLAAFCVAKKLNIAQANSAKHLSNFELTNGRTEHFYINNRIGTLLIAKHENSAAYNQSLRVAASYKDGCDVMIIVDQISRKYFTGDTSWLWDINFDLLNNENVHRVILVGKYVNDLSVRFEYTGIPNDKIERYQEIEQAAQSLENDRKESIFVITCFSDKMKFMKTPNVKKEKP